MKINIKYIYNDRYASKHHKEVKIIIKKPKKIHALNLEHLISTYPLQSIVVEDHQIEWDDHFKQIKTSIVKDLMMGGSPICILQQFKPLKSLKKFVKESRNIP
jgi:hypothetical protein